MNYYEVESQARELRELIRMREELEAEIASLQDAIKATMGDQEQIVAGEYKISWKRVTSARVDTKALKALMPDVAAQFTKTTEARRFTIN
ncbi:hypothetical protein LJC74_04020 [Eubacteriales bacterium OttesenSCG-928-A19]|nr:hypothetical protein [Eubacteriales bacterium OttesenSCG-928-A19]